MEFYYGDKKLTKWGLVCHLGAIGIAAYIWWWIIILIMAAGGDYHGR